MTRSTTFSTFLTQVRDGNPDAARWLIDEYGPQICRTIRMFLTDPRLRRTVETVDVCQSVFGAFFVNVVAGRFALSDPDDLTRLLVVMARNKVHEKARRERAGSRDARRVSAHDPDVLAGLAVEEESPGSVVADRDLLAEIWKRLSDEERQLVDARLAGQSWEDLAAQTCRSPDALRKQHRRALDRVARELKLQDASLTLPG